jgi:hypothetical protein
LRLVTAGGVENWYTHLSASIAFGEPVRLT